MMNPAPFFDSHGALWEPCSASHPDAEAIGPTGVARLMSRAEAGLDEVPLTAWAAALIGGRLIRGDEWDLLAPAPTATLD